MEKLETTPWDAAEYLDTEEARAEFLVAALEENDPMFYAHCLGVVERAKAMHRINDADGIRAPSVI